MFSGKKVLVSGASRGIGLAIAKSFLNNGAFVMLNDLDQLQLEKTWAGLGDLQERASVYAADISSKVQVNSMMSSFINKFNRIDILVNNAGIYPNALVLEMSEEDWDQVINVNLKGTFLTCQAAAREMIKTSSNNARIINISSGSYRVARIGSAHYCASKAGVVMLTKTLALELAPYGITVNSVAPGLVQPDEGNNQLTQEYCDEFTKSIPVGRIGYPEDIANAVKILALPEAEYITGEVVVVDGGLSAGRFSLRRNNE